MKNPLRDTDCGFRPESLDSPYPTCGKTRWERRLYGWIGLMAISVQGCGFDSSGIGPLSNGIGEAGASTVGGNGTMVTLTVANGGGGAPNTVLTNHLGGVAQTADTAVTGAGAMNAGGQANVSSSVSTSGAAAGGAIAIGGTGGVTNAGGTTNPGDVVTNAGGTTNSSDVVTGGAMSTAGAGGNAATGGANTGGAESSATSPHVGGSTNTATTPSIGGTTSTSATSNCVLGALQTPELVTGLDMDGYDLWGPSLSEDGLTLYFAASSLLVGDDDLYYATRPDRGSVFSKAVALTNLNTTSDDGSPCISSDGLSLYFYSTRSGGLGDRDLWVATRADTTATFGDAVLVSNVNGVLGDHLPWLSRDQLTLIFSSARTTTGADDLYYSTRTSTSASFSSPQLIEGVNSDSPEGRAALSNDGLTIYFVSSRIIGSMGDKDIWFATRSEPQGTFSNVQNLAVVNSLTRDVDVALSADEREMFLASRRSLSARSEIYRSVRVCL